LQSCDVSCTEQFGTLGCSITVNLKIESQRQIIIANLIDSVVRIVQVSDEYFSILVEYLEKLVGKARQSTVEDAEKMIREAEENNGELWFLSVQIKSLITVNFCVAFYFKLVVLCR